MAVSLYVIAALGLSIVSLVLAPETSRLDLAAGHSPARAGAPPAPAGPRARPVAARPQPPGHATSPR